MAPPEVQSDTRLLIEMIGPPPTRPGDTVAARAYVEKIERLLDTEDVNTVERRQLYKQRLKWRPRAQGRDTRWMQVGSRRGRLKKVVVEGPDYGSADDDDPIVKVIEQKFSRENIAQLLRG
jgi:hypothetical protein